MAETIGRPAGAGPTDAGAPHSAHRQRRPTGAPPPLPRKLGTSGWVWLGLIAFVFLATALFLNYQPTLRLTDQVDTWILQQIARVRATWLTHAARGIKAATNAWALTLLALATIVALMAFRRWRHLLVFFGSMFLLWELGFLIYQYVARPRPYGVRIIGGWSGFAMPSPPVGLLSVILMTMVYGLATAGRPRDVAKWVAWTAIAVVCLARLYLAVDHPSDIAFALVLGVGVTVALFRLFAPNEIFPVSYRRGSKAHLDIGDARAEAIRRAVRDQLGLTVLDIEPFGQEGSAGSTPLRLRVQGDPDTYVFAKLYTQSHVRADRWYKLWRIILYGRLEDETSFQNVRRFVEYEDYILRLLDDAKLPTPAPYGIVEITPEREYMLLMEFFAGAKEMGEAEVDDGVIDQGLLLIRKLWDAGVAHRDIKPANLMVRDGNVLLIDAFFVQVRPSPWRQAVDLGNMLLVLALRSDADRVYEHALRVFSPDELAEALAATHSFASPSQLRAMVKRDGRDLLEQFRKLAPPHRRIALQRWSVRRVVIAAAMFVTIVALALGAAAAFLPGVVGTEVTVTEAPECETNHAMILMAQAVPTATQLPCIASLPAGWSWGEAVIRTGRAEFWLHAEQGVRALGVVLSASCGTPGASRVDEMAGECVAYFVRSPAARAVADTALGYVPRSTLVAFVDREVGLSLCGAGSLCPG